LALQYNIFVDKLMMIVDRRRRNNDLIWFQFEEKTKLILFLCALNSSVLTCTVEYGRDTFTNC